MKAITRRNARTVARGLGWFSIGLGVAEVALGARLSHALGMGTIGKTGSVVRAYGMREIATGVWILSHPQNAAGVWARVAGDFLDLGTLWTGLAQPSNSRRMNVALAMGAVAGVTALDIMTARQLDRAA
jgi:hypothetical protein